MSFVLPALLAGLCVAAVIWVLRRSGPAGFAVLLLVLPLLPVLDLRAFSPTDFVHDRYLYVPSAGLCILAAMLAGWVRARLGTLLPAAAVILAAGFFAVLTVRESRFWKDDLTLSAHAFEMAPHNTAAQTFYTSSMYLEGRCGETLSIVQAMLEKEPENDSLHAGIGTCLAQLGAFSEAAVHFRRSISLSPKNPHAFLALGVAEMELGQLSDAEKHMREAIRMRPRASVQYQGYHYYLGTVLEKKGDLKGALVEFDAELGENPEFEGLLDRVIAIRARMGRD
jgi:tetratricopeptide (TPR) repeat protein